MSSKRRLRRKGCQGKVRHESLTEAWKHKHSLERQGETGLTMYHCAFCNGYHVGHRRSKDQKMKERKQNGF